MLHHMTQGLERTKDVLFIGTDIAEDLAVVARVSNLDLAGDLDGFYFSRVRVRTVVGRDVRRGG